MTERVLPELRPGRPEDAVACAAILNDWIDTREWMPRVHAPEDVVEFYQTVIFPKREVWVKPKARSKLAGGRLPSAPAPLFFRRIPMS